MSNVDVDVVLAEYSALRAEILSCQQAQTGVFVAGITATAAVGAFSTSSGTAPTDGSKGLVGVGILLLLPFVLSGLGLLYLDYVRRPAAIGKYIRTELWKMLERPPACGQLPCWERYLDKDRKQLSRRQYVLSVLPFLLVFFVPTVVVTVLGYFKLIDIDIDGFRGFWALWWLDVVLAVMLAISVLVTVRGRWHPAAWGYGKDEYRRRHCL